MIPIIEHILLKCYNPYTHTQNLYPLSSISLSLSISVSVYISLSISLSISLYLYLYLSLSLSIYIYPKISCLTIFKHRHPASTPSILSIYFPFPLSPPLSLSISYITYIYKSTSIFISHKTSYPISSEKNIVIEYAEVKKSHSKCIKCYHPSPLLHIHLSKLIFKK